MWRGSLFAVSVALHVAVAGGVSALRAPARREVVAITVADVAKPKAAPKIEETPPPPPDANPKPAPAPRAEQARAKPAAAKAEAPPAPATGAADALPDFGLAMSSDGAGGVPVAAAAANAAPEPPAAAPRVKTLARAPAADACDEPPAKPKAISVSRPTYPESQRGSGIEGAVRVEIEVDATGRVVAVRVLQGLGPAFDAAAVAAARAGQFEAAVRCGKPVASKLRVSFRF